MSEQQDPRSNTGARIAIGAGIGAALYAATGSPVWIAIGVAIGAASGQMPPRNKQEDG